MPELVAARERWEPRGVKFLAISVVEDAPRVRAEADRWGLTWPLAMTTGDLVNLVGVNTVPSTLFVTADGRIVGVLRGAADEDGLEEGLARIVN